MDGGDVEGAGLVVCGSLEGAFLCFGAGETFPSRCYRVMWTWRDVSWSCLRVLVGLIDNSPLYQVDQRLAVQRTRQVESKVVCIWRNWVVS